MWNDFFEEKNSSIRDAYSDKNIYQESSWLLE